MASLKAKASMLVTAALSPKILVSPARYLLILSHMRSRSSVFSHILGSSDQICGYSELHISYKKPIDFIKMRIKLYSDRKESFENNDYLLDKVLLDSHVVSPGLLESVESKAIFLVRRPEDTIRSIMNLGFALNNPSAEWLTDPEQAAQYYISRLATLVDYATAMSGRYYFVESESLITRTEQVLLGLTKWLNLDAPLQSEYKRFSNTGKPHHGDPSENIMAGRIMKTDRPKGQRADLTLPRDLIETSLAAYEGCTAELIAHAGWVA